MKKREKNGKKRILELKVTPNMRKMVEKIFVIWNLKRILRKQNIQLAKYRRVIYGWEDIKLKNEKL